MSFKVNATADGTWMTTVASAQQRFLGLGTWGGGTLSLFINPTANEIGDPASADWLDVTTEAQTADFARNLDFGNHTQFKVVLAGATTPDLWIELGAKNNSNA
jgi:hypothetical protein